MARRPDLNGRGAQKRRQRLIETRPHICVVCLQPIDCTLPATHPDGPTREHLIAVNAGGHPTDEANAALSHRRCNVARGAKPLSEARAAARPRAHLKTSRQWT
jgi:5-methylcytosine-specific restriction endonuclease McrA